MWNNHFVPNIEFLNGNFFLKNLESRKDFWSSLKQSL